MYIQIRGNKKWLIFNTNSMTVVLFGHNVWQTCFTVCCLSLHPICLSIFPSVHLSIFLLFHLLVLPSFHCLPACHSIACLSFHKPAVIPLPSFLSICIHVFPFASPPIFPLPACLSICHFICLHDIPFTCLTFHLPACLSVCPPVIPFVCLSFHLSACLPVFPLASLSFHLSACQYFCVPSCLSLCLPNCSLLVHKFSPWLTQPKMGARKYSGK